jgi:8-oxo-dGTP diphosphatase
MSRSMQSTAPEAIEVAAAAISDNQGRILVSRRRCQVHQGGLWELPGGKLERGETAEQALARELEEELGIKATQLQPLIRIRHDYKDHKVHIDFFRVDAYRGEPRGLEGQPIRWLRPEEMDHEDFPAADRPVISALQLPQHYAITGDGPAQIPQFVQYLDKILDKAVRLIQLRAHHLPDQNYQTLLHTALSHCHSRGGRLLVNRPQGVINWLGRADGVHLTTSQLLVLSCRPPGKGVIGASCHQLDELKHAEGLGLDYALLSPVQATQSHPHCPVLGWEQFAAWVDQVNLPVYALGGMRTADLNRACRCGAQGIAGISTYRG